MRIMGSSVTSISTINLDEQATFAGFARLVGITTQAAHQSNHLQKGGTYRQWLLAYCLALREQASNHVGANDDELRAATIREKNASAAKKEVEIQLLVGELVRASEVKAKLNLVMQHMIATLDAADLKIAQQIELEHDIQVQPELIQKHLRNALSEIAAFQSGGDDG